MPTTIPLNTVGGGPAQQAGLGSVLGFLNNRVLTWGWVVGRGGQSTHALLTDDDGLPIAWPLERLGVTQVLRVIPGDALVLSVDSSEANVHALRNFVGCLGLTEHGPVLCVGGQRDDWGHLPPAYVDLATGEMRDDMAAVAARAMWLTTWSLSMKGADDQMTRIIGSPDWPPVARQQR